MQTATADAGNMTDEKTTEAKLADAESEIRLLKASLEVQRLRSNLRLDQEREKAEIRFYNASVQIEAGLITSERYDMYAKQLEALILTPHR